MTIKLETPPGFLLRTDLLKAADDLGFRTDEGVVNGSWHKRSSTTSKGSIYLSGEGPQGAWFMSLENKAIVAEINLPRIEQTAPGHTCYRFESLEALRVGMDKAYKLGVNPPDAPLEVYLLAIKGKPQNTEVERLVVQRIGQVQFRKALLDHWKGTCCITGIRDAELLRASHIKPWARCESDAERLDVHNGLLLSALWDAAFDRGLVAFDEQEKIHFSSKLSDASCRLLKSGNVNQGFGFNKLHHEKLRWHRNNIFIA